MVQVRCGGMFCGVGGCLWGVESMLEYQVWVLCFGFVVLRSVSVCSQWGLWWPVCGGVVWSGVVAQIFVCGWVCGVVP